MGAASPSVGGESSALIFFTNLYVISRKLTVTSKHGFIPFWYCSLCESVFTSEYVHVILLQVLPPFLQGTDCQNCAETKI